MYDELVKKIRHCATDPMHCLSCGEIKDGQCFKRLMTQAADAIEELTSENKELSFREAQLEAMNDSLIGETGAADALMVANMPRWIPVTERLPDVPGTYLVLVKEPKKWMERRVKGEAEEWEDFDFSHVEPAFYNND